MLIKKKLAIILTAAMFTSPLATVNVKAEQTVNSIGVSEVQANSDTYTADKFTVKYVVDSSWNDAYNGRIIITNTGTEPIIDWALEFKSENEFKNIWGGQVVKHDGKDYTVKNASWNKDIKPGESKEFGFTASKDAGEIKIPQIYSIPGYEEARANSDYKVDFNIDNKWDGGYTQTITITNTSDKPINDWKLEFDLADKIDSMWNGEVVKDDAGHYVIGNMEYNAVINPGQSISLGYKGSFAGDDVSSAENVVLKNRAFDNDGDKDYDNDGVSNSQEEALGTDKNKKDTNGDGVSDGDAKYDVTKSSKDETTGDEASVDLNVTGKQAGTVEINKFEDTNNVLISPTIPGYTGSGYSIKVDGEASGKVKIKSTEADTSKEPTIYKYDEESQTLIEEKTNKEVGSVLTTEFDGAGLYIVLNKTDYDQIWKNEIKAYDPNTMNTTSVDIAFVIDSSGSMQGNDSRGIRKSVAKKFVDKLSSDDKAAVIDFDHTSKVLSGFTSVRNKNTLYNAIDRIDSNGGTSLSAGINAALSLFSSPSYNNSEHIKKCIIMLTDGDGDYENSITTRAKNMGVTIYTVGLGQNVNKAKLLSIATGTGGDYFIADVAGDLYSVFDKVQENAELYKDTDQDGISDYYEKKLASGEMRLGTGALLTGMSYTNPDSDGDGKLDGQEIQIANKNGKIYAKLISNPVVPD